MSEVIHAICLGEHPHISPDGVGIVHYWTCSCGHSITGFASRQDARLSADNHRVTSASVAVVARTLTKAADKAERAGVAPAHT